METYKYILDNSSKKHICPNCDKKTFVYYIDTTSGEYLTSDYGRCDRQDNCSYHKMPRNNKTGYLIEFLSLNDISDKACKLIDLNGVISIIPKSQILEQNINSCYVSEWYLKNSTINYLNCEIKYFGNDNVNFIKETKAIKSPLKPSYHSLELLNNMYNENPINDNLTEFLKIHFTNDEVNNAVLSYYLTGSNLFWNKSTVFWQIDNNDNIRSAKIMLYNEHTGKRIKEPYNHINWLHKAINEPDFNLNQCLFGLHLINEDYQKNIAIVESEKTAIIMSMILPNFIWLATGSEGNFKLQLLEPIKKRNIIAYPDKSEYTKWLNKATELNTKGFKISVSDLIEKTDFNNGFDLADYFIKS